MYMFPKFDDLKTQWSWNIYSLEDMQWYVDMKVISKEEYKEITTKDYPEQPQA